MSIKGIRIWPKFFEVSTRDSTTASSASYLARCNISLIIWWWPKGLEDLPRLAVAVARGYNLSGIVHVSLMNL